MVNRSWAVRATDRVLRSARGLSGAAMLKAKKAAIASVGAGILKRKKLARASEGSGKTEEASLLEPREILKLKKEAFEAKDLWKERDIPGALERWVQAKEEEAKAEKAQPKKKKTTMLVKTRLPDTLIDIMKMQPYLIEPISAGGGVA